MSGEKSLWTTGKKLVANLLPLILSVPFLILAIRELFRDLSSPWIWVWTGCFFVIGWVITNFFGLIGNQKMKREMEHRMKAEGEWDDHERYFVGFARPNYKGLLDPHEDVGFLVLENEKIEFKGSVQKFSLPTFAIEKVRFRSNIHSWVGLGRWVSIEATLDEKPIRLLVEPREKKTLIGNRTFSKKMKNEILRYLHHES